MRKYSLLSVIFIFVFIITITFSFGLWKKDRIVVDAPSYYTYLPAAFIYKDLRLNFIDKDPAFFKNRIWFYTIENGKRLIKHPPGLSVALSPFFLAGHLTAIVSGDRQDGYSMSYQNWMSIGVLVYLFFGLFYLRKFLLNFYSEKIVAVTLIALVLATNLLWYSTTEGLMPHAVSFSLLSICLYNFDQWLRRSSSNHLLVFAALFGLSILIRPLAITISIYFFLLALINKNGIPGLIGFLKTRYKMIFIAFVLMIIIPFIQLCYWKYATGKWIYDVYIDEHFIFDSPQMIPFLFSFRKGFFIYAPVFLFALTGLVHLYKSNRDYFYATIIVMTLTVFLLSSWWAWSYGISWGLRPMIDYYPILSLPLAAGFGWFFMKRKAFVIAGSIIVFLFICLNLFQTWQYMKGLIHYDDMTRKAYFKGFFQTNEDPEWRDLLSPYDWDRRIKGLPQIDYSKAFIETNIDHSDVVLRGSNLKYVTINPKAQNALASFSKVPLVLSTFSVERFSDGTVGILSNEGKYLSVSFENRNVLLAIAPVAGVKERFEIVYVDEDDNRVALKSVANGKYVSVDTSFHNILFASSDSVKKNEIFRLFIKDPK